MLLPGRVLVVDPHLDHPQHVHLGDPQVVRDEDLVETLLVQVQQRHLVQQSAQVVGQHELNAHGLGRGRGLSVLRDGVLLVLVLVLDLELAHDRVQAQAHEQDVLGQVVHAGQGATKQVVQVLEQDDHGSVYLQVVGGHHQLLHVHFGRLQFARVHELDQGAQCLIGHGVGVEGHLFVRKGDTALEVLGVLGEDRLVCLQEAKGGDLRLEGLGKDTVRTLSYRESSSSHFILIILLSSCDRPTKTYAGGFSFFSCAGLSCLSFLALPLIVRGWIDIAGEKDNTGVVIVDKEQS